MIPVLPRVGELLSHFLLGVAVTVPLSWGAAPCRNTGGFQPEALEKSSVAGGGGVDVSAAGQCPSAACTYPACFCRPKGAGPLQKPFIS